MVLVFSAVPFLLTAVAGLISSLGATMMEVAVSQEWSPFFFHKPSRDQSVLKRTPRMPLHLP